MLIVPVNTVNSALFRMKTRVSLKYFVNDCGFKLCNHCTAVPHQSNGRKQSLVIYATCCLTHFRLTNGSFLHSSENIRSPEAFFFLRGESGCGGGNVKSDHCPEMVKSFSPSPKITKHSKSKFSFRHFQMNLKT